MEAKELRIGNYIKQIKYRNGECDRIRKVSSLNKEGFLSIILLEDKRTLSKHPIEWFEPIPLTDEWLVKLGLKQIRDTKWFQTKEGYNVVDEIDSFCFYITDCDECGASVNIKYVHQLQNLYFALTGEELTIK